MTPQKNGQTHQVDAARLGAWFDTCELPDRGAPVRARLISGGTQNNIYEVSRGDVRMALRMPPLHAPQQRDDGIAREWSLVSAFKGSDVPHADAVAHCADPSVLGRPFYVTAFVEGWTQDGSIREWPEPYAGDFSMRPQLARELVRGAAQLAGFDWQSRGLADFGRPDGFHDRQVGRWLKFHSASGGRDLPGIGVARNWLDARRPLDFVPGVMHGDYQFCNVIYGREAPADLLAIIDWEMATIGDPKLDLAWALQDWLDSPEDERVRGPYDLTGMPSRDELLGLYQDLSGRQVDDFDYYLVLARWKLGIVLESGFQRSADNPSMAHFGDLAVQLMDAAAELAETTTYGRRCRT